MVSMLSFTVLVVALFAIVQQSHVVDGLKIFTKDVPAIKLEKRTLVPLKLCGKLTKDCINVIAVAVDDAEQGMINTVSEPVVLNLEDYEEFKNVVELYGLFGGDVTKGHALREEMKDD